MSDAFLGILALVIVVGVVRPLIWWMALGTSLWLGRRYLSNRWGRIIFGHFWRRQ